MEKLKKFFKEEGKIVNQENIIFMIGLMEIDNIVYGIDGDFDYGIRGNDHNSIYCQVPEMEFEELIKEVAIIVPEIKKVYYDGTNEKIQLFVKLL